MGQVVRTDRSSMKRIALASICVFLLFPYTPASADVVYPIVFPVVGDNNYSDTFGDPRGAGRTHEGVDIMAAKMTPVVAAASGTVGWMHDVQGGNCCALQLIHDDGYSSWYIHLNNDTPGTDDGQGWGFAPGITTGVHVAAGQLIGYVGDSGNAEAAPPHLHFELRDPSGVAFDPYPSLLVATFADPAKADEMFFYRDDGLFRFYDINPDGSLGSPLVAGASYTTGWTSITSVDLDGDGEDEMSFYRDDGLFRYYNVNSDGSLPQPLLAGDGYTAGWSSISAVTLMVMVRMRCSFTGMMVCSGITRLVWMARLACRFWLVMGTRRGGRRSLLLIWMGTVRMRCSFTGRMACFGITR